MTPITTVRIPRVITNQEPFDFCHKRMENDKDEIPTAARADAIRYRSPRIQALPLSDNPIKKNDASSEGQPITSKINCLFMSFLLIALSPLIGIS